MPRPKIGVALPTMEIGHIGPGGIAEAARRAEAAGLDSVGAADVLLGDGTAALEPMVALATAAAVTHDIALEFGVLSVPTRPLPMLAAQVQTLQYLSGNRVGLGLGIGGFPESPFWRALSAPTRGRGRQLDTALDLLPGLIAGAPTLLPGAETPLVLSPAAAVPPLYVGGGTADVVLRRVALRAAGWVPAARAPPAGPTAPAPRREQAPPPPSPPPPPPKKGVKGSRG
uniref:LLM class flavin-dependent oxidoreductase n=1 Tax=Nocardia wallacei TaxID=480035 RepID=UPI002456A57C